MSVVSNFFLEIDRGWRHNVGRIELRLIGAGALLLQTDYQRGTKDSDVLETEELTADIKSALLALAGKNTRIHQRLRMYVEFVASGLPFLPQSPLFHPEADLNAQLTHFDVRALDVVDVVVSKLKRFNANDVDDIAAMIDRGVVEHGALVRRFTNAFDSYVTEADNLATYARNLNRVERDYLGVAPSVFEPPEFLDR